jgi:hypothetical protein
VVLCHYLRLSVETETRTSDAGTVRAGRVHDDADIGLGPGIRGRPRRFPVRFALPDVLTLAAASGVLGRLAVTAPGVDGHLWMEGAI